MTACASIVIATRNRSASLAKTIECLLRQRVVAPCDIIVVDNASTDDTAAVVNAYVRRHPHLRYAFEPVPGPGAARNLGVSLSASDLVLFTDDDIRPSQTWVASMIAAAAARPDIDCFGGRILPAWPAPAPRWLTNDHWTGALALQDYGQSPILIDTSRPLSLASANMAVRRRTLIDCGAFLPEYLYAEDTELLVRLWRAGHRCLYVPDAVVIADIQPERMKKAYHRAWHRRNAQWTARMRLDESFDREGRLRPSCVPAPTLFGVPAYLYRQFAATAMRYAAWTLLMKPDKAFLLEKQLWQLGSYVRARATDPARRRVGHAAELLAFASALLLKKWPRLPPARP